MVISSCQVQQRAGWLLDRYDMKLPGKHMLPPLQEAAVTSCTCRCVYVAWAGYAGVQESLEQMASCGATAPPCCLAPSWHASLEMWGETVSEWWQKEHACRLGVGTMQREFSGGLPALQGFCSLHLQGTILCELEAPLATFCSSPGPASYSALNPPKRSFVSVLQWQFGDNTLLPATSGTLWTVNEGPWHFARVLVLYLLVY